MQVGFRGRLPAYALAPRTMDNLLAPPVECESDVPERQRESVCGPSRQHLLIGRGEEEEGRRRSGESGDREWEVVEAFGCAGSWSGWRGGGEMEKDERKKWCDDRRVVVCLVFLLAGGGGVGGRKLTHPALSTAI